MCGIFGIYYPDKSKKIDRNLVVEATNLMYHRGPDDSGFYVKDNIGLGHRRLSIIDLSHGHQPMFNEDDSIILVYNGEIYNHTEIRDQLISRGHIFKTKCDTEVIIHAYEEWGHESVQKFNGMFAFVLWDSRKKNLWVVRDRLGIKPLYYYWDREKFICASEIKPLLKTGLVNAQINEAVLDAYFTLGYVPGPKTMFKNIYKVDPGNFLILKNGQVEQKEYWDLSSVPEQKLSFSEAKQQTYKLFQDSIKKRLMSDVSLGVFLSGGLDSSAIVALMNEIVTNRPIKTFTVGYDAKYKVGEEAYAKMVADKFDTEHHLFKLEPDNFFSSLNTLVAFSEEPVVESAAIALYHISKKARENAIVLLSGEGSDEIFGGYRLYRVMNNINSMHKIIPPIMWKILNPIIPLLKSVKQVKYLNWLGLPVDKSYMGTSNYLTDSLRNQFYSAVFMDSKGDYLKETFAKHFDKVSRKKDFLNKLLYVDTKTWLVDDLLVKADKMTMAASIELRVPFLDHRLVELAASLDSSFKIANNGSRKHIFKSIMQSKLPNNIIYRKKMGFPVPTKSWLGKEIFEEIKERLMECVGDLPWWNRNGIEKILKQQNSGKEDHSKLLMMLLVLISWKKKYIYGKR